MELNPSPIFSNFQNFKLTSGLKQMFVFPWFPLFVLFSPAFFILCFGATCLLWWAMELESGKGATGVVAGFLVAITVFGGTDWVKWTYHNPSQLAIWVVGYFVLGLVWGVVRWTIFCHDNYCRYQDTKRRWLDSKGIKVDQIPDDQKQAWLEYCYQNSTGWVSNKPDVKWDSGGRKEVPHYVLTIQPLARNSKARIMTWMAYWPFSITWWVLRDFFSKIWDRIYRLVSGFMDRISAWMFKGVNNDFPDDLK